MQPFIVNLLAGSEFNAIEIKHHQSSIGLYLLHVYEVLVHAGGCDEFGVGALLHYAALLEYADFVGVDDCGESVGDYDCCSVGHEFFEGFLHESFAFGVEGRGGFVEDEDSGVLKDCAGDADSLALTAGESAAAVADEGVVAMLCGHDEFMCICDAGGLLYLLACGALHSEGDVIEDGVVEEDRLLVDVAHQ